MTNIGQYIDHTNLKPTATPKDIAQLCKEAIEHNFFTVCVHSCYVDLASLLLKDSNVKVCAVIGFPLGAMSTKSKIFEAKDCIANGATEIDMVINNGWLSAGNFEAVEKEIAQIKSAIGNHTLKVILETSLLASEAIKKATQLAINANADFVKTSTGFGSRGASFEDIELMQSVIENDTKIKASGGIRDFETAKKYIELGVSRIGTSSGIKIAEEAKKSR